MPRSFKTFVSRCERCSCELALDQLSPDHRCPPCEVAYFESRDRIRMRAWFTVGFVLPWLLFAWVAVAVKLPTNVGEIRAFTTGVPMLDLVVMTVITAVFAGKAAVAIRRWAHRRTFERVIVGSYARRA